MSEFVTDDGEVLDYATAKAKAKSSIATFKFELLETVRGDPRLRSAPCEAVVGVLISFLSADEHTLKPTLVYASNITILARTTIKTKATVIKARKLLEEHGYLVKKSCTASGCDLYQVRNPHYEYVQMHMREKAEKLKSDAAVAREEERRRKAKKLIRGTEFEPTENHEGFNNCTHKGSENIPNIVEHYRGKASIEEEQFLSAYGEEDNQCQPLPVPASQEELEHMMTEICSGVSISPAVTSYLRRMLLAGELTPAIITQQRSFAERHAA
ncbi:hypothetical protein [Brucella intermedia]|uniref:hypothetical protein n=1 Tax=Brucella intermedia TaxID=94625 RepID=UPI00124C6A1F|nr:hypothetical protein [Brucella intermedia]KAB2716984.1 hypothetical protein F9K75_13015 [Brucella intermedia]